MFNTLLSSITKSFSTYVSNRQEQKKLKLTHKNKIQQIKQQTEQAKANAQLEFAKTGQTQDFSLDKIAMKIWKKAIEMS